MVQYQTMAQIIWTTLAALAGAILAWLWLRNQRPSAEPGLAEHITQFQKLIDSQITGLREQLDRRLSENTRAMDESKRFLAGQVGSANQSIRSVSAGLGKLEAATSALQKTSTDIASFQKMLTSPKIRGTFGEVLLNNLLSEVLPTDRFELQYPFSDREIADAIIRLQDGYIVAIDAKFPLSNYQLYHAAEDKQDAEVFRKSFIRDIKKHISDISKKYISSQQQTLDYAFMYIPVEGVYYETMIKDAVGDSLWEYCLSHRVIPVSPNSLLAYLQTVLVGLRGMKIEQQAREILDHIGQLRQDFGKFADDFTTVGTHLSNAKNRYDDSARRLDKFSNRLDQIENTSPVKLPEPEVK